MGPLPIVILAVDNTCLGWMQFQSTFCKPRLQTFQEPFGFLSAMAVHHSIVRITSKRFVSVIRFHPFVKRIMEKQVR
jgi:hypothetical protein